MSKYKFLVEAFQPEFPDLPDRFIKDEEDIKNRVANDTSLRKIEYDDGTTVYKDKNNKIIFDDGNGKYVSTYRVYDGNSLIREHESSGLASEWDSNGKKIYSRGTDRIYEVLPNGEVKYTFKKLTRGHWEEIYDKSEEKLIEFVDKDGERWRRV